MVEENFGLEVLMEVSRIANSTLDLDQTLEQIIQVIHQRMNIDACAIYLRDENKTQFQIKASSGLPREASTQINLPLGQGVTGWVAEHKKTLSLSDAKEDPRFIYFREIEEEKFQSMLSSPVIINEECIGVINVHTRKRRTFTDREIALFETIAHQVSGCINNAMLYNKSRVLLKELSVLYDISLAAQTTLKLEHGLWIILSGITMGEAGGFNRAMLFVVNEKTNMLQGMMGLGPDSPEDAGRVWTELSQKGKTLLQWIITEADKDEYKQSHFNQFVRGLKFPIRESDNILAETLIQKQRFNITDAVNHPLVDAEFVNALGTNAFATVPLVAQQEVMGVILADNRYNQRAITGDQLRLLTRFASHASWVMENSRLFSKLLDTNRELLSTKEQLIQYEKFAALGEMAAEVAHEIKNPLVSIGGFARRLQGRIKKIPITRDLSPGLESAANYSDIIVKEVERLEHLLKDILTFSKTSNLEYEECNINHILEEVSFMFKMGFNEINIDLDLDLQDNLPPLRLDKQKIKQVLINLFYNSMESMSLGGNLLVRTYTDNYVGGQAMITICIQDTGGGIPQEIFDNIFNPFFTTKDSGTGMGLPICRKIIEGHEGTIRIENVIGKGVTVFLHLPLQKKPDYIKT